MPFDFDTAPSKRALAANRELQTSIEAELDRLRREKLENRAHAEASLHQLATLAAHSLAGDRVAPLDGCNYERKWSRRFFVDPKGTEPKPNPDTVKRHDSDDSFFYHLKPPFSKPETKQLLEAVALAESKKKNDSSEIELSEVANALQKNRRSGTCLPRTAQECKIYHAQLLQQKTDNFSKEELESLSKLLSEAEQPVNWNSVAVSMSYTSGTKRTAFQCLAAFQTKLAPKSSSWTPQEDELLLKFLAASGPQTVLEAKNPLVQQTLLTQLLPSKSKKQLFIRANQSLLNPNLVRSDWTTNEERRLPILMHVYHGNDQDLFLASTHFARGTKSLVDKWQRSLNPAYSSRPFSTQEDEALMQVLRNDGNGQMGWTELSQKYFPSRHPQRLMNRWSELASDKDILNRELPGQQQTATSVAGTRKRQRT